MRIVARDWVGVMDGTIYDDQAALAASLGIGNVGSDLITPVLLAGGSGTRLWPV